MDPAGNRPPEVTLHRKAVTGNLSMPRTAHCLMAMRGSAASPRLKRKRRTVRSPMAVHWRQGTRGSVCRLPSYPWPPQKPQG